MIYCNLFHLNRLSDTAHSMAHENKSNIQEKNKIQNVNPHRVKPTRQQASRKNAWNLQYILQLAVEHAPLTSDSSGAGRRSHCAHLNVGWQQNQTKKEKQMERSPDMDNIGHSVYVAADGPMICRWATTQLCYPVKRATQGITSQLKWGQQSKKMLNA